MQDGGAAREAGAYLRRHRVTPAAAIRRRTCSSDRRRGPGQPEGGRGLTGRGGRREGPPPKRADQWDRTPADPRGGGAGADEGPQCAQATGGTGDRGDWPSATGSPTGTAPTEGVLVGRDRPGPPPAGVRRTAVQGSRGGRALGDSQRWKAKRWWAPTACGVRSARRCTGGRRPSRRGTWLIARSPCSLTCGRACAARTSRSGSGRHLHVVAYPVKAGEHPE